MFKLPSAIAALAVVSLLSGTSGAFAASELITNGNFSSLTNGNGEVAVNADGSQRTTGTNVSSATGWYSYTTAANSSGSNPSGNQIANTGYPFLFFSNNAVTNGFYSAWDTSATDDGHRYVWGASNGGANTWDGSGPNGTSSGNYLVMDADYHATAISQNVSGLTVGQYYTLTFAWAAAQWKGNTGATTERLDVTFDNKKVSTNTVSLASQGFQGWMSTTMNFTYTGASNVLSFLAVGTPAGYPPMVLLDNVSMMAAPEPASIAVLGAGLFGLVAVARRRRNRAA